MHGGEKHDAHGDTQEVLDYPYPLDVLAVEEPRHAQRGGDEGGDDEGGVDVHAAVAQRVVLGHIVDLHPQLDGLARLVHPSEEGIEEHFRRGKSGCREIEHADEGVHVDEIHQQQETRTQNDEPHRVVGCDL